MRCLILKCKLNAVYESQKKIHKTMFRESKKNSNNLYNLCVEFNKHRIRDKA
jgi:hypothetical protein